MGDEMNEAKKDDFLPSAEATISPQKQAILEIAQGLFAEQGYAGLSIRDLADHCGLAKATVYHHFRDKQELFLIVLEQEMLSLQAAIIAAAAEQASALDKLRAVVYTFCRIIAERRLIIMSTLHATPEVAAQLRAYIKGHRHLLLKPVMEIVQEGIDEGVFRPVNVQMTALSLLGTLHAFVTYQTLIADAEFEEDIAGHVWNLFLNGIIHPQ